MNCMFDFRVVTERMKCWLYKPMAMSLSKCQLGSLACMSCRSY